MIYWECVLPQANLLCDMGTPCAFMRWSTQQWMYPAPWDVLRLEWSEYFEEADAVNLVRPLVETTPELPDTCVVWSRNKAGKIKLAIGQGHVDPDGIVGRRTPPDWYTHPKSPADIMKLKVQLGPSISRFDIINDETD